MSHWAEKDYEFLTKQLGLTLERRYEDKMTRGEVISLISRSLKASIELLRKEMKENIPPVVEQPPSSQNDMIEYIGKGKYYVMKASPERLNIKVFPKTGIDIAKVTDKHSVNGTFYTSDSTGATSPTTPLIYNGTLTRWASCHGKPQSCIIINKDNTVEFRKINNISELNTRNIKHLLSGVGLVNKLDPNFRYNPASEGFTGKYWDPLRETYKTIIGYRKSENKLYLIATDKMLHSSLEKYDVLDVCKELNLDFAISLDGGGSTYMKFNGQYKIKGSSSRYIHNILTLE